MQMHGKLDIVYSEATHERILEDAVFFLEKAAEDSIDDGERKRYSRIVILLMALYLESLSNRLCDIVLGENWKIPKKKREEGVAETIIKFKAIYEELFNKELALYTGGIQDIFTIRNRIIAHPAGRSKECIEDVSGKHKRTRMGKVVKYQKFINFPFHYSHFTLPEAVSIFEEAIGFRRDFLNLIKERIPADVLNEIES